MTDVFVLCNQHNEYLTKSVEWLGAGDSKTLYRTEHRDEAINQKVELTVKHPELRIKVVKASVANNGRVQIDGAECLPKAEAQAEQQVPAEELPALATDDANRAQPHEHDTAC